MGGSGMLRKPGFHEYGWMHVDGFGKGNWHAGCQYLSAELTDNIGGRDTSFLNYLDIKGRILKEIAYSVPIRCCKYGCLIQVSGEFFGFYQYGGWNCLDFILPAGENCKPESFAARISDYGCRIRVTIVHYGVCEGPGA